MKSKTLKQLELENDKALVAFWKSAQLVADCKFAMNHTNEAIAYAEAEVEHSMALKVMAEARLAYLEAKIAESES